MPKRSERSKSKKFRRKASGKAKAVFVRRKTGKHHCPLCKRVLHGVAHGKTAAQVRKLSKTKRRPTGLFAGVLCGKCRSLIAEEAAKVEAKAKKISEVELRLRKYVEQVKVD
jgi:ribosomal protein L34E